MEAITPTPTLVVDGAAWNSRTADVSPESTFAIIETLTGPIPGTFGLTTAEPAGLELVAR